MSGYFFRQADSVLYSPRIHTYIPLSGIPSCVNSYFHPLHSTTQTAAVIINLDVVRGKQ